MSASPAKIAASLSRSPRHAVESFRPLRRSHSRQIAQTLTPPSVNVEQSPHTGSWQEAHGPAGCAPQWTQRVPELSSTRWRPPVTLAG